MIKKLLKFIFIFLFACTATFFVAKEVHAADPVFSFEPSTGTYEVGKKFEVKLYLSADSDYDISSFNVQIIYDKSILQADTLSQTAIFPRATVLQIDNTQGKIHYGRINITPTTITGKIHVGTIAFVAKEKGASQVTLTNTKVTASRFATPIQTTTSPANFVVGDATRGSGGADCEINGRPGKLTDFGCIANEVGGFVSQIYGIILGFLGGVSVLFIIYSGYLLMVSRGNELQLKKAQGYMKYAIIGLLLAIFGFVFFRIIAVDVLHIPGFG